MFDSIGWGEVMAIAVLGLFIFGPERLPTLAKEAADGLKRLRIAINNIGGQVQESLGDDITDLREWDIRRYHPKSFIRAQLFGDDDVELPAARPGGVRNGQGTANAR